jgi:hypothetical protein
LITITSVFLVITEVNFGMTLVDKELCVSQVQFQYSK